MFINADQTKYLTLFFQGGKDHHECHEFSNDTSEPLKKTWSHEFSPIFQDEANANGIVSIIIIREDLRKLVVCPFLQKDHEWLLITLFSFGKFVHSFYLC